MKLCWLVPNDHGGGVISVALSCCRRAAAAGHDVTLLMLVESSGHVAEYATFRCASLGLAPNSERAPRALTRWLNENPQDVLFVNDCSLVHPALPHIPQSTRSVIVVHDTGRQYWKPVVRYEATVDAIVAVSQVVADQFRHRLRSSSRIHVVHNGTIFPENVPLQPPEERANDLLFSGGDKPFKGAVDVLNVWPVLISQGFTGALHWYGQMTPSFRRQVDALPAVERVHVHGRVPRSVLFERAAASKVILVPSRVEPFGMVTVEGMGMGCVPVAWDIETGTREIVTPEKDGLLVPLGDIDRMAQTVRLALEEYSSRGSSAITVARERFSEQAMWERYEKVLESVTNREPVVRPRAGETPPMFRRPMRYFQLLPDSVREFLRGVIARSPKLSYWLRDWRGL